MDEFYDLLRGLKLRLQAELPRLLENPQDAEQWGYIFMETFKIYNTGDYPIFILGRSTADAVIAYNETQGDSRIDVFLHKLIRAQQDHLQILLKLDSLPLAS